MRSLTRSLAVFTPLLAVLACGGGDRPTGAPVDAAPRAAISDGANGGNPRFYFLPPVAAAPAPTGTFSAVWRPTIVVCELVAGACGPIVQTIGPSAITVSAVDQLYQHQWSTDPAFLAVGTTYRLTVTLPFTPALALGHVDVLINAPGQSEGAGPGGIVAFNKGRNVPLKFRIEQGIGSTGGGTTSSDYGEFLVPNTGGVYAVQYAGVYFTPGWLGAPETIVDPQVTLIIERLAPGTATCRNDAPENADLTARLLGMEQYAGCYRYTTVPSLAQVTGGPVRADVTIAMCTEVPTTSDRYDAQTMFKYDAPTATAAGRLKELENVAPLDGTGTPFLTEEDCAGFRNPTTGRRSVLLDGMLALAGRIGGAFAPRTAWALDFGSGGRLVEEIDDFSDFFWGVTTRVDINGGNGQSTPVGTLLAAPISVRVTGAHVHPSSETSNVPGHDPLSNVPVTFTVATGDGTLGLGTRTDTTVVTNASGIASVPWVVGLDAGANAVTATIPDDAGRFNRQKSVTLAATGTATVPRNGAEVRILGPAMPRSGNDVTLQQDVTRPFNAKAYKDGVSSGSVCRWSSSNPSLVRVVVPGSDPGAIQMTGLAVRKNVQVDVKCYVGTTVTNSRTLRVTTQ